MKKKIFLWVFLSIIGVFAYSQRTANVPAELDFTMAAEKSIHAVVHIKTEFERKSSVYDDFFGLNDPFSEFFGFKNESKRYPIIASGSGVIISENGYIVTNNHVVQDANAVFVTLNDKREFEAEIVGTDPLTDLALIKIQAANLPILEFANSDNVR
ncbi:MAG: trypsin-like peptidase domain-containing protein, partial [Candidatus Izemoplasmatales bacterium]